MRNMLAFVAALVLTVAGVGFYLDWFKVRTASPAGGRRTVNIDINTDKIGEDLREGGEYLLQEGGEKIQEIIDRRRKAEAGQQADGDKNSTAPQAIHGPPRPESREEESEPSGFRPMRQLPHPDF